VLTSAKLYTGACGVEGPSGVSYAGTLEVGADMVQSSIDHYRLTLTQSHCTETTYVFAGDTFGVPPPPFDRLNTVTWTCPSCPSCSTSLKYSGTPNGVPGDAHGVFTLYFPLADGTLLLEFTE
jgi:hypothetical protein